MKFQLSLTIKFFLVVFCFSIAIVGFMVKLPADFRHIDKELHALFYFGAAAFLNLLFVNRSLWKHLLVLVLLFLFGLSIEYAQEYSNKIMDNRIHGRFDPEDVASNLKGLLAFSAVWLVYALGALFFFGKKKQPAPMKIIPKSPIKTFFVDAFTTTAFKGNPAAVCLLHQELSKEQMQAIATEIGFSETAFVQTLQAGTEYQIRYFSPKQEIPLCGHATLSAAKILFDQTGVENLRFITGAGVELPIQKKQEEIIMTFPTYDTVLLATPHQVLLALGLNEIVHCSYSKKNKIILLEIADANLLAQLRPNFTALVQSYTNINGVLVTAPSNNVAVDFHYRYFWPWAGTNEDPVTGGVQTFLAKYWSLKLNKKTMKAFQSSERTGFMTVELTDDKVLIYGNAVVVFEGNLLVQ